MLKINTLAACLLFQTSYAAPGASYRGTLAYTDKGKPCQYWIEQTPHKHQYTPHNYQWAGVGYHNYCRNPSKYSGGLWCYTTDSKSRWEKCYVEGVSKAVKGAEYKGNTASTVSGRVCQHWTSQRPHRHEYYPHNYRWAGVRDHNYCRNPSLNSGGAWCYTTDTGKRWEYCNV